jgi:DNA polymerase-1
MYRLVSSQSDLDAAVEDIRSEKTGCGLDTETYGAEFTDRMFALQISTGAATYYFNLHAYAGMGASAPYAWAAPALISRLKPVFDREEALWFIHNAKFDLRRLAIEGTKIRGQVHCTQMCERFVYNQHTSYSLAACLERRGLAKDDAVASYIVEHKLWTMVNGEKRMHFEKVPFDLMFKYGCIDAEKVRLLGLDQRRVLDQHAYYHNDLQLQKVAYEMEEIGIRVRTDYAQGGADYERSKQTEVEQQISDLAGEPFRAGPKWLRTLFDRNGVPYRTNPKTGNPKFDKSELDKIEHPVAGLIRQYRKHEQYAGTYYDVYSKVDTVHAFIKLWGTDTGRFSYAEPNLQNVPKEESLGEDVPFQVRGCFAPRSDDHVFVMVDFNQQEFRLMLDYAGEHDLIKRINDHGEDVHQATADLVGVTRKMAKTINFGLLYGMGAGKLAQALKLPETEAKAIRAQYFAKLPRVKALIEAIIQKAERRKYVETWVGRKLYVPAPWRDPDTGATVRFEYVMPNHLIQGGCGDIARLAMVAVHGLLSRECSRSAMLLQVHDELLFEIHRDELGVVDGIVEIMENTYRPFNGMKLTCGVEHSWVSWGKRDVVAGAPLLETV